MVQLAGAANNMPPIPSIAEYTASGIINNSTAIDGESVNLFQNNIIAVGKSSEEKKESVTLFIPESENKKRNETKRRNDQSLPAKSQLSGPVMKFVPISRNDATAPSILYYIFAVMFC